MTLKKLAGHVVATLAVVMMLAPSTAPAQSSWQQMQLRNQRQAADQARRAQQAAQNAERQRQAAERQRQAAEQQRRAAEQARKAQQALSGRPPVRPANPGPVITQQPRQYGQTGPKTGPASNGIRATNQNPTPAQQKRGFTGKVLPDGRALVKVNNRVLAVPASRVGVRIQRTAANQNANLTPQKRAAQANRLAALSQKSARRVSGTGGGSGSGSHVRVAANDNRTIASQLRMQGRWMQVPASRVNAELYRRGYTRPFTVGSKAFAIETKQNESFVRLYHPPLSNKTGSFVARLRDVKGQTPEQLQKTFALPRVPTKMVRVDVPKGSVLIAGEAGEQPAYGADGGALQYYLPEKIDDGSFGKDGIDLPPNVPL